MNLNSMIERIARLAVAGVLAASMGSWGVAAAVAAPADPAQTSDGCYGNMQHQGDPTPAKCGIGGVATPNTLAPGIPSSATGVTCAKPVRLLLRPELPLGVVASLDESIGRGDNPATAKDMLIAGQGPINPCCLGSLNAPAFSTFGVASLDDALTIPKSAGNKGKVLLVGC